MELHLGVVFSNGEEPTHSPGPLRSPPRAAPTPSCSDALSQGLPAMCPAARQAGVWVLGWGMWGNCHLGGRSSGMFHDGGPALTVRPMLSQENGEQPRAADPDPGRQETRYNEVGFS